MTTKEWLIVLAGAAAGPAAVLGAAPLTVATAVAALLSFIVGAGATVRALNMDPPGKREPPKK